MVTETLAELEKAAQEIRDGLKNVNEDIKKLTGRDPSDNTRPVNRRVQLKRNAFNSISRHAEPQNKQRRESTGTRRWGRTLDSGGRTSIDESRLESSGDEDESSKPAIQSVIATELKPARSQTKDAEEDTKTKSRNRRMFGFLVGTLQKFKEDTRQKTVGEKKREEIEKKLEQKAEEEKKEVSSQRRELFQTRREKQQELKSLERKMENAILKEQISAHNSHLQNFIRLKSEPQIFYLPVKHNEETAQLLEESQRTLEDLQQSRFKAMDEMDEGIFTAMVRKGVDKGKDRKAEGVEVRDVGHRNLFDEEREQVDLDKEEGLMMDDDKQENVEWNKMEEDRNDESAPLRDRTDESEEKRIVVSESESSTRNMIIEDKEGDVDGEKNEQGSSVNEGTENTEIQLEGKERFESNQREEEEDATSVERSDTEVVENKESLQEKLNEDMDTTAEAESNTLNSSNVETASGDIRPDEGMKH